MRELPGFPQTSVGSHAGQLVLGHVGPTPVAVLQGRAHYYEHGRADEMKGAIRAMAALGCETLLQTNAAGSLRLDMPPGSPMAISDHINFTGVNPLFGETTGDNRFVDMVDAYDPKLVEQLLAAARAGQHHLSRRRLCLVLRTELRDAGGDPGRAHAGRRRRRHVDRAGDRSSPAMPA